jgi:hypothetical protein
MAKVHVEVNLCAKIHKYTHIYATANSDCSWIYQHVASKCPKAGSSIYANAMECIYWYKYSNSHPKTATVPMTGQKHHIQL